MGRIMGVLDRMHIGGTTEYFRERSNILHINGDILQPYNIRGAVNDSVQV